MKTPFTAVLISALLLAGCATQPKEQIAAVRAAGVSSALVYKLERGKPLTPADIIELRRHHVNDAVALRQLDRAGVDYVVDKDIIRQLRKAGVSESVITAAANAGQRFEEQYHRPYASAWVGPYGYPYGYTYGYGYPYDPFYYSYARPYPSYHHHHDAVDFLPPGPHRWIH